MMQLAVLALMMATWAVAVAFVARAVCALAPGDLGFDPLPDDDEDCEACPYVAPRRPCCRTWREVRQPDGQPAIAMCRA